MPMRPKRPCRHLGCAAFVESGYCDKHKQDARQWDKNRASFRERGYDSRWDKVRALKIKQNPLCEECLKHGIVSPAEIVHHIKPVDEYPELLLDMENLVSLCRQCHGKMHSDNPRG